ncbi:MAG: TlpA disulfide reductase family protein [Pseudomonadota bacterium]
MATLTRRSAARRTAALALSALLYAAAGATANTAHAADTAALKALATGAMSKLVIHNEPREAPTAEFVDHDGNEITLADFEGKVAVVNFWATWCPPCRAEMPSLDRLEAEISDEGGVVIALSTDFGSLDKPAAFYQEVGLTHLGLYHDRSRTVAREAAVLGLPVTLIIDPEGLEVGRLVGDAHWDSPEAIAVVRALSGQGTGG